MSFVQAHPIDANAGDLDDLSGTVVEGRYEILRPLGEGGMGAVFEARHVVLGQRLAMKVLHSSMARVPGAIERLKREAYAASAIGNRHIVDVRDFGTLESGQPYVIMEYLDGAQLFDEVAVGALPWERATRIGIQVAEALSAAHACGIVHRDIKAENVILLDRDGEPDFVKVLDFGIAKLEDTSGRLTQAGEVLGTPHYMSPEQCTGGVVDQRTDVYALGILLYEMVTGFVPFDNEDVFEVCRMQIQDSPLTPSELIGEGVLPGALEALILKCLAKNKAERFETMDEIVAALSEIADEASGPMRISPPAIETPTLRPPRSAEATRAMPSTGRGRRAMFAALGATLIATLSVAAAGALVLLREAPRTALGPAAHSVHAIEIGSEPVIEPTDVVASSTAPTAETVVAPQVETLTLDSTPSGAEVYIDGDLVGTTPVTLDRPDEVSRLEVTLSLDGYESRAIMISHLSGQTLNVPLSEAVPVAVSRTVGGGEEAASDEPPAEPRQPRRPADDAPAPSHTAFLDPWR